MVKRGKAIPVAGAGVGSGIKTVSMQTIAGYAKHNFSAEIIEDEEDRKEK